VFGKLFWAAGEEMVTSHKVMIFVPSCNSTLWNTGSAKNLTLTITFLKQCEYLSTGRSLQVFARCIFVFDLLCLLVGPHPPNGYNPPLREEDFFCVTCVVLSSFVYWLAFCVLTCLLFYALEFVYIATSAE
jgi:hypothetical protein